jgi:hypothetical protein
MGLLVMRGSVALHNASFVGSSASVGSALVRMRLALRG